MTIHNKYEAYSVTATEDLTAAIWKGVTLAGTVMPAATAAGASGRVAGILTSQTRSGDQATYAYEGIVKVVAGVAVSTLGYPLAVGSSGFAFAVLSGNLHSGRFLATCASGDLVPAFVDFKSLPPWAGV
jgi:hypothetical protein